MAHPELLCTHRSPHTHHTPAVTTLCSGQCAFTLLTACCGLLLLCAPGEGLYEGMDWLTQAVTKP